MEASPTNRQLEKQFEIGQRLQEWVTEVKKWSAIEFGKEMGITRTNVYKYFNGQLDPQGLFVRLQEQGCDLHWLSTGEKATGETRLMTQEQADMLGFLEERGITLEDLRQIYKPDMSIEEFIRHYQAIQAKVISEAKAKTKSKARAKKE